MYTVKISEWILMYDDTYGNGVGRTFTMEFEDYGAAEKAFESLRYTPIVHDAIHPYRQVRIELGSRGYFRWNNPEACFEDQFDELDDYLIREFDNAIHRKGLNSRIIESDYTEDDKVWLRIENGEEEKLDKIWTKITGQFEMRPTKPFVTRFVSNTNECSLCGMNFSSDNRGYHVSYPNSEIWCSECVTTNPEVQTAVVDELATEEFATNDVVIVNNKEIDLEKHSFVKFDQVCKGFGDAEKFTKDLVTKTPTAMEFVVLYTELQYGDLQPWLRNADGSAMDFAQFAAAVRATGC